VSTPVINYPKGLVSLLGLRDMGGVPRELDSTLQGGIDLTQFLLIDRQNVVPPDVITVTAVAGAEFVTVPAGELWYVHEYGIRSSALAAGERISFTTMVQAIGGSWSVPNGTIANATNVGERGACHIREAFWLNPGGALAYQILDIATAGSIGIQPVAIVSKFRV